MSDLQKYIKKRKARDPELAKGFDTGYEQFKIGVLLKQAREEAGLTQSDGKKKKLLTQRREVRKGKKTTFSHRFTQIKDR